MAPTELPTVSALTCAYNYGRYIGETIESAMAQDYPPELLEMVIVDDGSTDDTEAIVAGYIERFPGRIKYVRQQNAGPTAAVNRARAEASGALMALLDADDIWLPDKTRKQVALMQSRPELGLVWSRMRLIDGGGQTIRGQYGHQEPMPENQFARVLWENMAVQSSLIIKAELFGPMPPEAVYADWWLSLMAAQFQKIDYLTEDLVLYRWHDANITGGVGGAKALREAQKGIAFQRWLIRSFYTVDELRERLSPEDVAYVWTGLENQAQKGLLGLRSHFGRLATVDDDDRAGAALELKAAEQAEQAGDLHTACILMLRARAGDPFDAALHGRFDALVVRAKEAAQLPDVMAGSGPFPVLVDAAFLLEDDDHLRAYAAAMRSLAEATLVIDATALDEAEAAATLHAMAERCDLGDENSISMIGLVGELHPAQRFQVQSSIRAVYGVGSAEVPVFMPTALGELQKLASTSLITMR